MTHWNTQGSVVRSPAIAGRDRPSRSFVALSLFALAIAGCSKPAPGPARSQRDEGAGAGSQTVGASQTSNANEKPGRRSRKSQPVELGPTGTAGGAAAASDRPRMPPDEVVVQLQPFQVLLGQWRWITQKKFGDFPKSGDDVRWVWDFKTRPGQPGLGAQSETSPYFRSLWITATSADSFEARLTADDGAVRVFQGTWVDGQEPRETPDGKILQRTFALQMMQVEPVEGEQWQLTVNLIDNNQYLLELKKRPTAQASLQLLDTVRQQREGTSFAVADSDNPGPKCIISGGLGTMTVSYQGKSYPVCCSGCAAAFNDEPEKWLSRLKKKE